MLDFSFDKPVQILDFLDRLPQSRQHRQWQNRTGGELLTGTTWTLEMRDEFLILFIFIAWHPWSVKTFVRFVSLFSSHPYAKPWNIIVFYPPTPNLSGCASILWRSSTLFSITSLGTVPYDPWFVNTGRMLKIMVHSAIQLRFPYCVLYHISWDYSQLSRAINYSDPPSSSCSSWDWLICPKTRISKTSWVTSKWFLCSSMSEVSRITSRV